jgi:hypothetical protein
MAQEWSSLLLLPAAFARADVSELPSPAETPAATEVPSEPYLLIESWHHRNHGPGCERWIADFDTFEFDRDTGELVVVTLWGTGEELEADDIGYFGCGARYSGNCMGASSTIAGFRDLPYSPPYCGTDLKALSGDGHVVMHREGEDISLHAGQEWVSDVEVVSPEPGCTVTVTHRISNHGYQDRSKIKYFGP